MIAGYLSSQQRDPIGWDVFLVVGAAVIALVSARGYAGGWNDGSRLATVECLVDYHTLAIDRSVFVQVPVAGDAVPYPRHDANLLTHGTRDKLLINGQFYSDKSPVPALLMAGVYQCWQRGTGQTARQRPDSFCYVMTVASSGLAYVVAVWCIWRLGLPLGLPRSDRLLLTVSFALATVALPYVRHVNNHILLLAVGAAVVLNVAWLAERKRSGTTPWLRVLALGSLAGLGYAIDLGAGPVLLVCTLALVAYRSRSLGAVTAFLLAALPWLALHHAVNYAVGGTFQPANAVAEYLQWPGSPFTAQNMTGGWKHPHVGRFLTYSAALLVGKQGFLGHNLPLFLAVAGLVMLLRQRTAEFPELLFAACWLGGTWLMYAANSNNYSGLCCSIRWFVPVLAFGYYGLAVLLRQQPQWRGDVLLLSGWGLALGGLMWWHGPWAKVPLAVYWPVQAAALLSWALYRSWSRRRQTRVVPIAAGRPLADAA